MTLPETRRTCPVCHIGRMQPRRMTYTMVYEGTLISVPDSPAAKCDFCHDVVYDTSTLQRIDILMRQAGSPQKRLNSRGKLLVDRERRIYGANGKS